jgi:hypothetical protein
MLVELGGFEPLFLVSLTRHRSDSSQRRCFVAFTLEMSRPAGRRPSIHFSGDRRRVRKPVQTVYDERVVWSGRESRPSDGPTHHRPRPIDTTSEGIRRRSIVGPTTAPLVGMIG